MKRYKEVEIGSGNQAVGAGEPKDDLDQKEVFFTVFEVISELANSHFTVFECWEWRTGREKVWKPEWAKIIEKIKIKSKIKNKL